MVRLTTYFTGRVQGVGFRWTTQRVAKGFDVTGYVMNLSDGRVKCVCEGTKPETAAFIAAVKESMARNITQSHTDTAEATGAFDGFHVRH